MNTCTTTGGCSSLATNPGSESATHRYATSVSMNTNVSAKSGPHPSPGWATQRCKSEGTTARTIHIAPCKDTQNARAVRAVLRAINWGSDRGRPLRTAAARLARSIACILVQAIRDVKAGKKQCGLSNCTNRFPMTQNAATRIPVVDGQPRMTTCDTRCRKPLFAQDGAYCLASEST